MSIPYLVFQLQDTGEGMELHSHRVLDGLCCLVHMIIRTSPIKDPHTEQAEENWIIDTSPINLSKPFHPSNHVCPKPIVEEKVWVHVPPPPIFNDGLIIGLILLDHTVVGVLGYL